MSTSVAPVVEGTTRGVDLLVPAGYDVLWTGAVLVPVVVALVLLVVALVRWWGRRAEARDAVSDLLVILGVPVLGPAGYLLVTRRPDGSAPATTSP